MYYTNSTKTEELHDLESTKVQWSSQEALAKRLSTTNHGSRGLSLVLSAPWQSQTWHQNMTPWTPFTKAGEPGMARHSI